MNTAPRLRGVEPLGGSGTQSLVIVDDEEADAPQASTTDPAAMPYRKRSGAVLYDKGHVLMENRNGLVVDAETTRVSGHAERMAAVEMIKGITSASGKRHVTVGADLGFNTRDFVEDLG